MPWGGWPDWGKGGCAFWLRCCGSLHSGPPAVIISADQPHTSARNSWPAIVVGLTLLTDRVRIDLEGEPSAVADVTPSAVSELELTCGSTVWLTAKATELEVYGADVPPGTGSLSTRDR